MLWFALACTPAPDTGACPDDCDVAIEVVPPAGLTGTLTVRSDPPGYAFGGDLRDADGNVVTSINGLSEADISLLPGDLIAGETYTVALGYACTSGAAQPVCEEMSFEFEASESTTTTTTTTGDGSVTDVFTQETAPRADVLFVVDNSCSMYDEQSDLVQNFPIFFDYFLGSGIDFHIGVVSTDMDNPSHSGKLRSANGDRWVDANTPNASLAFTTMATLGTNGSGTEKGLGAAYTALELEKDAYNAGFLRDTASLHVVVLSDERDQTPASLITVPEFIDWFEGLRPDPDDTTFSSIVTLAGFDRGASYIAVTDAVGGIVHDITDPDYGTVLEQLGIQASGLKREFFLSEIPDPDTLDVTVEAPIGAVLAFELDEHYTYDAGRNSITFLEFIPESGSQIVIHYVAAE